MAKRKRSASYDRKFKEGRGQGVGIEYKPWITIQDVPSLGRATRLKGFKVPRQFEFLSDLERNYFYLLEYSDSVVDIREQYPLLPIEETIVIADELGIKYPADPKTGEPIVMTTDFLVTTNHPNQVKHIARTLKYKDELMNKRVLEKFEIERVYWERHDIDWGIVTELEVHKNMAHNIASIHGYSDLSNIDGFESINLEELEDQSIYFIRKLLEGQQTIRQIATGFDYDFVMPNGCGLSLFKHLLMIKAIEVDLMHKLDVNQLQHVKSVRKDFSKKVEAI
ncbi:heteromeric transposase endonuclease subunit TnsA [Staphylococcus pseudintermedius]|uniref:TnsA endonuclease N-terminal domain-containing protein n=2 Tax=Staphylococcus pseudintermedius TaxID=283734 RepID=UPI00193147BC|nr:TnsA endonuclease N-terminal domain-containing protein [Staphylococcus pseudintermedius]EGQ3293874.1 heteromeric transposase endonuclease subunit TnsA [Staphylococcus pseudintermedius]EGQ3835825.1 heteromeric transposase endonuclease subunit TnsA [Staphylococcus pseudintermedius]EGQ4134362.1 heteromeric transposase endonuclease subunit TnsA [Staphylococcus pseudintermedius]EGQ4284522.1 heteromeric transposase endonuclease subunit TnsA [Staphylococcus pseudintermedius]EHK9623218.1 heteromeri